MTGFWFLAGTGICFSPWYLAWGIPSLWRIMFWTPLDLKCHIHFLSVFGSDSNNYFSAILTIMKSLKLNLYTMEGICLISDLWVPYVRWKCTSIYLILLHSRHACMLQAKRDLFPEYLLKAHKLYGLFSCLFLVIKCQSHSWNMYSSCSMLVVRQMTANLS